MTPESHGSMIPPPDFGSKEPTRGRQSGGGTTKTYLAVFGALAVLTAVTVGVSYLHLNRSGAIGIALFIAFVKVSLIATFFMHLKFEKNIIRWVLFAAVFFVLVLLFSVLKDLALS